MKPRYYTTLLGPILFSQLGFYSSAPASPWNFPVELDEQNTQITFSVDSTWHSVSGVVQSLTGNLSLEDPLDYRTISAEIMVPTISLFTNNKLRDSKMFRVMEASKFPYINFTLSKINELCQPEGMANETTCPVTVEGKLTIRDVTLSIDFPATITKRNTSYLVAGRFAIDWSAFGVADPSILVAKVGKIVNIHFSIIF